MKVAYSIKMDELINKLISSGIDPKSQKIKIAIVDEKEVVRDVVDFKVKTIKGYTTFSLYLDDPNEE